MNKVRQSTARTSGDRAAAHHVELLLKLLIGVVDTELLEAVDLERLEPGMREQVSSCRRNEMREDLAAKTFIPVDVEDPDKGVLLDVGDQSFVDVLHDPVEELGVDVLGQGVASVGGLQAGEGLDVRLRGRLQLPVAQPLGHVLVGDADQVAERRQVAVVWLEGDQEIDHLIDHFGYCDCCLQSLGCV